MLSSKEKVLSVTAINYYIKDLVENDQNLKMVYVKGEVSNAKLYGNGNFYFTLKDEQSAISVVLFSSYYEKLKVCPKDGDQIIVIGSISLWPVRGTYNLRAYDVIFDGEGQLLLQFEALKKRLATEGLFDSSHKRMINKFPSNIGIVTAYPSAACEDLINNIKRRYPITNIYIYPSLVQGVNAPKEIMKALDLAYKDNLDTLIIARGGGSIEDLWCFNDEELIRKLYDSPIPTISAIGHEIDFTLCDFVCDVRASTPTGAAELSTVDQNDLKRHLQSAEIELENSLKKKLLLLKDKLNRLKSNKFFTNQKEYLEQYRSRIDLYALRLKNASLRRFDLIKNSLELKKKTLDLLKPQNILNRGYSYMEDENGKVITSVNDVNEQQVVKTHLKDGKITVVVLKKGD